MFHIKVDTHSRIIELEIKVKVCIKVLCTYLVRQGVAYGNRCSSRGHWCAAGRSSITSPLLHLQRERTDLRAKWKRIKFNRSSSCIEYIYNNVKHHHITYTYTVFLFKKVKIWLLAKIFIIFTWHHPTTYQSCCCSSLSSYNKLPSSIFLSYSYVSFVCAWAQLECDGE